MSSTKKHIFSAKELHSRIKAIANREELIQHCLDNTRTLHKETENTSELLFFAMIILGKYVKGTNAVHDFINLYKELGLHECAGKIATGIYTADDLAYFWSTDKINPNWFESSNVEPIDEYKTSNGKRPITPTLMGADWGDFDFHEIDKVPAAINPRSWGLYRLENATILYDTAEFVVLDEDERPIPALSTKYYAHVFFSENFRKCMIEKEELEKVVDSYAELSDAVYIQDLVRQPNYCHWMLDQLPRTRHYEKNQNIIMYKLAPFMKNILELAGMPSENVHVMGERSVVRVKQLSIESSMAKDFFHPCQDMNTDLIEYLKNIFQNKNNNENVVELSSDKNHPKFVYLSRDKTDRRKISNEKELLDVLEKYNFTTIYSEELSMSEQVALFEHASVIVSPHGAGLTNIVFSKDLTLIEIFNQNYGTPTFYLMAALMGFNYQHLLGTNPLLSESERQKVGLAQLQCDDIEVDLPKLEEVLKVVFAEEIPLNLEHGVV